ELLEPVLGGLVARIPVRVILHRQLAEGPLDFVAAGVPGDAQYVVVIVLRHRPEPAAFYLPRPSSPVAGRPRRHAPTATRPLWHWISPGLACAGSGRLLVLVVHFLEVRVDDALAARGLGLVRAAGVAAGRAGIA